MMDIREIAPIQRLTKDIAAAAKTLSDTEARFLVDAYYMMQDDRKRAGNQAQSLEKSGEPNQVLQWLFDQSGTLEKQIARALDKYTEAHPMGAWMRGIKGIGPVLSAGLLANIDITRCPTAGHIWAFAGWAGDSQKVWKKGEKRPFSAGFRTLCWKVGQSFLKLSGDEECYYGQLYRRRKEREVAKNEAGEFAEQAGQRVGTVSKTTDAYKFYAIGKLPPAHIDARARRWAVKLFLAHLHAEWYLRYHGREAPLPYPIAFLGHAHEVTAPN